MDNIQARMVFENSIKSLQQAFPGQNIVRDFKLTQSYLRLAQLMAVGSTIYTFPLL
jgi:hypothetical protein